MTNRRSPTFCALYSAVPGTHVRTANGGYAAIEKTQSEAFDLLLSDVRMVDLSGHEVVRWFARNRPAARTILMSAFDPDWKESVEMIPADCPFIYKPFVPKDLLGIAARTLQNSHVD